MTSLQSPQVRPGSTGPRSDAELRRRLSTTRPLVPTATAGGAIAAGGPLLVCLALGVVGWFLTDAGGEGTPTGALGIGAHAWLMGHGSGVTIEGVRLTAVPLGITLMCAWTTWRLGHRIGEAVSGHGPDADRIADGERDWTVPVATGLFLAGYVVVGVLTAALAATAATSPSMPAVVLWSTLIAGGIGGPAIARGSGRAAIWLPLVPATLRGAVVVGARILRAWLLISLAALLVALVLDFSTAANVVSQLHADSGGLALIVLATLAVLPNATLFSSAFLLGPGFSVGTGTTVSTGMVVLGPLPMFPILAALPDQGTPPGWVVLLMALPVVVAFVVAARLQRDRPVLAWDRAAIRGCAGGIGAGGALAGLTVLAGGAVGPGRMSHVGPYSFDVLLHAISSFGVGGLAGALVVCWWQRDDSQWLRARGAALRERLPHR